MTSIRHSGESGHNAISRLGWTSVALAGLLLTLVQGATGAERGFASFDAARDLVYALEQLGLTAIATDDPAERGTVLAAMYIPRSQLFVVSARHPSAEAAAECIANHQYQEVYLELYGSPDTRDRFFLRDSGVNLILSALPDSDNVDVLYENGDRLTLFTAIQKVRTSPNPSMTRSGRSRTTVTRES